MVQEMEQPESNVECMDALLFALVLEMGLLQIRVLDGSSELRKYTLKPDGNVDQQKLSKLERDREMVKEVFRRTLVEMAERGEWGSLQEALEGDWHSAPAAHARRLHHERLISSCAKIAGKLATKRKHWADEICNGDKKVAVLRDTIQDEIENANARLCFADKWLCARAESLDLRSQRQRAPLPNADNEHRVHEELTKLIELQIQEREEAEQHWRKRYSDDIADINARTANVRDELQETIVRRDELQKLYDLHAGEMRSWLSFKQQRADRLEREDRRRRAATNIQSWWRGMMVRRGLGSFRYLRNLRKTPSKSKRK